MIVVYGKPFHHNRPSGPAITVFNGLPADIRTRDGRAVIHGPSDCQWLVPGTLTMDVVHPRPVARPGRFVGDGAP